MIDVLNAAVPPHQRRESWFVPCETDPVVVAQRKAMVLGTLHGEYATDYLDDRLYMDGTIDITHPDVPAWVHHAIGVMTSPAHEHSRMLGTTPPSREMFYLLSPITGYGLQLLLASLPEGPVTIHSDAIRGILEGLGKRIMHTCVGVANVEIMAIFEVANSTGMTENAGIDVDDSTYNDLYRRYPGLPYVLGTTISQWHSCVVEMLTRLQHDHGQIATKIPCADELTTLRSVSMDTGDLHDGGRSVAILEFDNNVRIVYKPKDLRIVQHVQMLFEDINGALNEPLLHVRRLVLGHGYAWEEYVSFQPCHSIHDVAMYYRRYGAMIRMYEQLEARDLWLDNIVAHGAWPVVIDLEMVLQPWLAPLVSTRPSELIAQQVIADTCYPIGLVTMMFPIAVGQEPEDMGGLTPQRSFRTPFMQPGVLQHPATEQNRVMLNNSTYTPMLHEQPVDVRMWHQAVHDGYQHMSKAIDEVLNDVLVQWGESLSRSLPVRAIYRDTWTYQQLIYASCSAGNLRSVYHREAYLLRIPRSCQQSFGHDSVQYRAAFSELSQLRQLDIPYFVTFIGDGVLREGSGSALGTLYHGDALERYKLRCSRTDDMCFRSNVLAASIATGYGGDAAETRIDVEEGVPPLDALNAIVDELCSWAIRDGDDYSWVSFLYHQAFKGVVFESLRPTMRGSLQIAVALRKAQVVLYRPDLTPIIDAIVSHAVALEASILRDIANGMSQPWYDDPSIGLQSLQQALATIHRSVMRTDAPKRMPRPCSVSPLRSSTHVPPRLWLVGPHGVCAMVESLVDRLSA